MNFKFDLGAQVEYDSKQGISSGEITGRYLCPVLHLNMYQIDVPSPWDMINVVVTESALRYGSKTRELRG